MSKFSLLCADSSLWDPTTSATLGSLDFCPDVTQFQVHTITQGQLTTFSQVGAWGDTEKSYQDMAFLLIVPSLAIGCKWVFGLTTMSTHSCQVCLPTLADVAKSYCYWQMKVLTGHMPTSEWMMPGPGTPIEHRCTLVSWLVTYLVGMPAATCTNYTCGSYCNAEAGWLPRWAKWGTGAPHV